MPNQNDTLDSFLTSTLKAYYTLARLEKKTGRSFEDTLYKAEEILSRVDCPVTFFDLKTLEEYFAIPIISHMTKRRDERFPTVTSVRNYFKHPNDRYGNPKMLIGELRGIIEEMYLPVV